MRHNPFNWIPARLAASVAILACVAGSSGSEPEKPVRPGVEAVAKAEFPAEAVVGGETLPLRGRHTLKWWGLDVYTAAFYVAPDRSTHDEMLAADASRKLVLRYHRRIDATDIAKATERAIAKNPEADVARLRERLDRVYACYSDVRDGDEYHIVHDAATERTEILLNGESQCIVGGDDFARAFFGIWLGPHSIASDMSRDLGGVRAAHGSLRGKTLPDGGILPRPPGAGVLPRSRWGSSAGKPSPPE